MTVAHLNLIGPGFPNTGWQKAFKENGFTNYIGIDWVRMKNKHGYERMWPSILHNLKKDNVDLMFMQIQSPGALTVENINQIRDKIKCKLILYNIDARYPEEVKWIYDVAPSLDYCALSNNRDVDIINESKFGRAGLVQSSCDMDFYNGVGNYIFDKSLDIVFIANNYRNTSRKFPLCEYRQSLIEKLQKWYPEDFFCFGRRQKIGPVIPQLEREIYHSAKIAICCSNFDLPGYTSDRIWRAMASGCFVLIKYFEGIEDMFEVGKHLDVWRNEEELRFILDYYLKNPLNRSAIASAGANHVRENHTLTHRVKQIMEAL